jgi:UDP-N-acetylmuramate--alanine ligase
MGAQAMLVISHASCGHLSSTFHLRFGDSDLGEFHLGVPGIHNVRNATAAIAIGLELEIPADVIREGLSKFAGVDRRFQQRGQERGITVIDDYGHHPTEIRATLAAARDCRFSRIHAIFQPHRYTRTMHLMDDFARSFHGADHVYLLDIYAASERPIEGVTTQALADRMAGFGHRSVHYVRTIEGAVEAVAANVSEGDAVLTLGAGNVWQTGDRLLQALRGGSAAHG